MTNGIYTSRASKQGSLHYVTLIVLPRGVYASAERFPVISDFTLNDSSIATYETCSKYKVIYTQLPACFVLKLLQCVDAVDGSQRKSKLGIIGPGCRSGHVAAYHPRGCRKLSQDALFILKFMCRDFCAGSMHAAPTDA
jgi:hypothetical protein